MKANNKQLKKAISKGDRLNWPPLKGAVVVKLTLELTRGKALDALDLERNKNMNTSLTNPVMP